VLGLPGYSPALATGAVRDVLLAAAVAFLLAPVIAWVATLGRGYMPPLGFALAMLALGQIFSKTGWAEYFPYSIVPLFIGAVGKPVSALPAASYVIVALTFVAGIAATIAQLRYADNTQ
jgi:hypothetical protein